MHGLRSSYLEVRPEIQGRVQDVNHRKELHYRIVDSDIVSSLKGNDTAEAEDRLRQIIDDFECGGMERTL